MKDLRPLLIDCRIELRKHQRDFQKSELCERLDLMLQSLIDSPPTRAAPGQISTPSPAAAPEKAQTVSQVALAWQTAARDLKFTDPAIYQRLSEKVMRLLGSKTLVDPSTEILQLQADLEAQKQSQRSDAELLRHAVLERDTLLAALADAIPELGGHGDRLAIGLAQIAQLRAHGPSGSSPGAPGENTAPRAPAEPNVPTPDILQAVASGVRTFSDDQRNWAVGEGMVLSGFQLTPVELVQQGDRQLAQLILDKQPA